MIVEYFVCVSVRRSLIKFRFQLWEESRSSGVANSSSNAGNLMSCEVGVQGEDSEDKRVSFWRVKLRRGSSRKESGRKESWRMN